MQTNEVIGYSILHICSATFVHVDHSGTNYMDDEAPLPISRGDAYRRLAGILDQRPDLLDTEFSVEPVYRELTPVESTARELGSLLTSLCARNGLNLGLTQDQIEGKIAQELAELGASRT